MKACAICGTSEDKAEVFGLTIHGHELGCSACINVTHFPLMKGAIVRHRLSGHAGVVYNVAQHRSRTPYYVEFGERGEGAFAERDLVVVPATVVCGTCGAACKMEPDGHARCAPCQARWKVAGK
jgi:hypothetical protein